jgi:hypothetical protein
MPMLNASMAFAFRKVEELKLIWSVPRAITNWQPINVIRMLRFAMGIASSLASDFRQIQPARLNCIGNRLPWVTQMD